MSINITIIIYVVFIFQLDLFSYWELVAEKHECGGDEENAGRKKTLEECANSCRGVSSMFVYGTNDFGQNRCSSVDCLCYCELSSKLGQCNQITHNGYRLYRYKSGNSGKSQTPESTRTFKYYSAQILN